jgi:hypothetical protein
MMLLSSSTIHWLDFNLSFAIVLCSRSNGQLKVLIMKALNGPEGWKD